MEIHNTSNVHRNTFQSDSTENAPAKIAGGVNKTNILPKAQNAVKSSNDTLPFERTRVHLL